MIIQKNDNSHNSAVHCEQQRLKPSCKQESLCIHFLLKQQGLYLSTIARKLNIKRNTVYNVVYGRRRSLRVEAEIARVLGKASWNEVVAEARLAVSGNYTPSAKDVSKFLEQTYRQYQKRLEELEEHHKQMAKKLEPTRAAIAARKWKR